MDQSTLGFNRSFDKTNAAIAAVVTLIAFVIYRLTVAQTLSYWDCGEFIACSHILGNPHPPGTPLFILVGRFFDLLPIASDVAFRINMMSAMCSTFTAMFSYLIIVRLVSSWYTDENSYKLGRIIAYASGIIGALFVAFSRANWTNSVETEPRSMAILIMVAILWLTLKWFSHRFSNSGIRIILLVAFLALLAMGVHLTVFLVIPIVTILFSLKENVTQKEWALVSGFFVVQLGLIFALAGNHGNYKIFLLLVALQIIGLGIFMRNKVNWPILIGFSSIVPIMIGFKPFVISVTVWLIISGITYFIRREKLWLISFLITLFALSGYSVHAYIPIRSAQHPVIDENTPSRDFRTFVNFLDRKQYGSMSMTERMFERRGEWANQFGDHARMGFLRFFKEQYSHEKIFPLFFLLGLLGMFYMAWRNPRWGYLFCVLVLVASVGLVLYMNFADGTQYNKATGDAYQEVRDRYYFFTPAFVMFGMAIGLGFGAIMEMLRKLTSSMGESKNKTIVYASLLLVLTPIIPCQAGYFHNDRSNNRMAYNYAYNILSSCDKNAIIFTSGDNDTFPVWCVQEIYNYRKDVRVINFSLLNTDWYTWQLKNIDSLSALNSGIDIKTASMTDGPLVIEGEEVDRLEAGLRVDVPMTLTDEQILWEVELGRDGKTEISRPVKPFYDRVRKKGAYLVPTYYEGKTLKVAQLVMEDIILTNGWKYPIHFTSASGEMRTSPLKLLDRCYRQGIILKLTTDSPKLAYTDNTDSLFFEVYKYDNLSDTLVAQSENISGIALAFPEKMLDYHAYLMRNNDTLKADSVLDKICEKIPSYWRSRITQADRARLRGDTTMAMSIEQEMMAYQYGFYNKNKGNIFFHQYLGMTHYSLRENEKAEKHFLDAWALNHDKERTFRALLTIYAEQRRAADMLQIAREFKEYHDDDPISNEIIQKAQYLLNQPPPMPAAQPAPVQVIPNVPEGNSNSDSGK
ncbi:MAG: DUF2723 domain-containing protein [candidate division Zixibacteria bacterium]|nr:DUF2723 domain-containing protein [candidate division Zixibacteria bacterium]